MITSSRHPLWTSAYPDWNLWRSTYAADEAYIRQYLKKFSNREDELDYQLRMDLTPVPAFAASAIEGIKNSIFQRLADVSRSGGSEAYQHAIAGNHLGVDRRGLSMNAFLGQHVLSDLLVMGKVGVYVDNSVAQGPFLANQPGTPYLYHYACEDILNWEQASADQPSEFKSVLLLDRTLKYDAQTRLPLGSEERFRLMWIDDSTGKVNVRFMNDKDEDVAAPQVLELTRIPFVLLDLGDSMIRRVARHQIALLNLTSSDVTYAIRSNHPFYTEQKDLRESGSHLKQAATDGSANAGEGAGDVNIKVGASHGRAYDLETERPGFIHPSSEPLQASLKLQDKLERDINRLVNLAVSQLGQQSAESKEKDNQGLEAGLSYIGLMLQSAELKIATHWAEYESRNESTRRIAVVKYPDRYSLKTDADRIEEADKLGKLLYTIPGRKAKKEIAKQIVRALIGGKVQVNVILEIEKEIDNSEYLTSDPKTIIESFKAGLSSGDVSSQALGFIEGDYSKACVDHVERVKRLLEAQGGPEKPGGDPAARGAPDLSANPGRAGADEKELSRETDMRDTTESRVRGDGK